ncbi:MAG TPA: Trm112 family protein [Chloroflexota bacterium]|nr:Trm112 family protein [Chloroflexota bacterium]
MVSEELLEILVCPACRSKVSLDGERDSGWLNCEACGRRYPIRDGVPIMLIEEGDKHRIQPP